MTIALPAALQAALTKPPRLLRAGLSAIALISLLSACTPVTNTRGNLVEDVRLAEIQPGLSTADDVLFILGTPTTVAPFDDDTWYYIGQVTEELAFYNPEIIDRRVVKLTFDETGLLSTVEDLSLEEGQAVDLVDRETPTRGREISFLEQMIGNLGRFNN